MAFQNRTWVVERVCWILMGIVIAAALGGVFAVGPLSEAQASDASGLVYVEYKRFQRVLASSTMRVALSPEATSARTVAIRIGGGLATKVKIEKVVPDPAESRVTHEGIEFVFRIADFGKPATILFYMEPHTPGRLEGSVGVNGRGPARVSSFVYP